jgi:hypothetical protein
VLQASAKRMKRFDTSLSRATQLPLIVRYRFKQGLFHEFLGNQEKALKHHRRGFEALMDMQQYGG